MANTVSTISYANTFGQWMIATDALIGENNTLAKGDYTKDTGTIYLSETTKNALQSNGTVVVQKELLVQGPGSSASIDNNLTVYGQVYFSNTTLGLTNSGQANINGLLIAQGPNTGLYVANSAYVGGNTTIAYNTVTNTVQANSSVITGTLKANTNVLTGSLQANTNILTGSLQANTSVLTGALTSNTSVLTDTLQSSTSILTSIIQANTSIVTGTVKANTSILTGVLQANTSTNTQISSVTQTAYADKVQANTSILTGTLQANTSTNTATASVAGTTFTKVLQANTSINTPIISVSNSVIANDVQANNVISTPSLLSDTITANTSASVPTLTVGTKLDGNNAAVFVNSLQVQGGGLSVNGNFTLTGTTVYASNTFQLSTGVTSAISSYIQVDRGSSGVNAAIRWSEPSLYWETLDVTGNIYSRIITESYLANQTGSYANTAFIKANSAYQSQNTTGVYANSAFSAANSASLYANAAFIQANSAFAAANNVAPQLQPTFLQANSAFIKANSAYESQNTTGVYANSAFSSANSASLYANSAFLQANAAFASANNVAPQVQPIFNQANAAFIKANSAYALANTFANTFVGTTGSVSQSSGVISFSSNNGLTIVATSANNLAISTSQDLRTTGSPTFVGATFSQPVIATTMATSTSNTALATTAYVQNLTNNSGTLTTNITGNSGTVTNGVYVNGSYADPSWITSLANTKITGVMTAGQLATTSVAAASYGSASYVSRFTVDAQGRLTSANSVAIAIASGAVSGLATSATTDTTNATNITSGTLSAARLQYTMDQAVATGSNVQHNSIGVGTAATGTAGEIRATNEITAYYSDDNLKTRLGTIENALDKLCSLTGFYYQANETAQALGYQVKREVGVSAQEVQKVMPEIVVPAPIDEQYLTVHYERLLPLVIESIKELKLEIDKLKNS